MIALLISFVTNLEWLALRNLVFSGASLFKSSIKHFLRLLKSKTVHIEVNKPHLKNFKKSCRVKIFVDSVSYNLKENVFMLNL